MTNRERTSQFLSNKQQATSNKQQATSNKQQATSNKQQATSNKQQATNSIKRLFIALTAIILALSLTSCGGGGGGGGAVSSWHKAESGGIHNSGDAGGWGSSPNAAPGFGGGDASKITSSKLLIGQSAAVDVSTVDIDLVINGVHHSINNVTSTTTTDVLPEIKTDDRVSGTAVLHLRDGTTRTAELEVTSIGLENNLKFKVPYRYTAVGLTGATVASGTYYARDGINLGAYTDESISGWLCSNGTMHFGSYVSGVRGDITLTAQLDASAALQFSVSSTTLYSENYDADTATITLLSTADGPFTLAYDNELISCTGSGPWTVEINDSPGLTSGLKVWYEDNTIVPVTITDTSTGRMGTVRFMLKNKFAYSIVDASGNPCTNVGGNAAGTQLSFATAKAAVATVPAGRTVVAFENMSSGAVYKETDFPITLNSTNCTTRSISLKAVLDFTCSRSDGGYGTTASPLSSQNGTSTNPYLLNYYGNDTNKRNQIELEISDNKCTDSALTIGSTQTAIVSATFDITHTSNKFLIKIKPTLAENDVYTTGTIKLTITDPTTGAKKDIHVLLKKNKIGSKTAPDAVGDIVFNDGSASPYTDFDTVAMSSDQVAGAVAVIFDVSGGCKGIGLNQGTDLEWALTSSAIYATTISTLVATRDSGVTWDVAVFSGPGATDGSGSLAKFRTAVGAAEGTLLSSTDYPAWAFVESYATTAGLTGTYATGWYMPSIQELCTLFNARTTVNNALDKISSATRLDTSSGLYWSSSHSDTGSINSWYLNCGSYMPSDTNRKNAAQSVCVIRAF